MSVDLINAVRASSEKILHSVQVVYVVQAKSGSGANTSPLMVQESPGDDSPFPVLKSLVGSNPSSLRPEDEVIVVRGGKNSWILLGKAES